MRCEIKKINYNDLSKLLLIPVILVDLRAPFSLTSVQYIDTGFDCNLKRKKMSICFGHPSIDEL